MQPLKEGFCNEYHFRCCSFCQLSAHKLSTFFWNFQILRKNQIIFLKIFENFKRSWWLNRTELTKCNNIWSYIRYRIPPSVVALKFSYGSSSTFFWDFENFWKNFEEYKNFENFKKCMTEPFWIFQKIKISKIFEFFKNFECFKIFLNFSKFLKISKKVDNLWALSWKNAITSEVIFVIKSLLPSKTFWKF